MNVNLKFLMDLNENLNEEERFALVTIANMIKYVTKKERTKESIFEVSALTSSIIRSNGNYKSSLGNWKLLRNSEIPQ